jgi:DNA-binding NarL/FixJ family response regulator
MLRRILLADDHDVVRAGLRTIISQQPDWSVCGEAEDGDDAAAKAIALKPDLVIMDITMPGLSGIAAARKIRDLVPTIKILIFTMHDPTTMPNVLLASGADGFISKNLPWPELSQRIATLLNDAQFQSLSETNPSTALPGLHPEEAASESADPSDDNSRRWIN